MTSGGEAQREVDAGFDIAMKWAQLPPEHLQIALQALEPQLKREHQARMAQLEAEAEHARLKAAELQAKRTQAKYLTNFIAALVVTIALLVAAVLVAAEAPWLSAVLSGPSLILLAKFFVLRRDDTKLLREVSDSARAEQEKGTDQKRQAAQ
ncbi:hypothetical protein [Streptomyces sp. Ag109_G2-15]|uniref:hypothetical protein n=1 Tax=Streptomyces sp. Ag109_G2-15 TaxID=1938850 RepID=UPI000BD6479C|nr:hypothetical protein [Streptomyces sp. Ag109_G2-15]SOD83765.1 hypothetical protein SAMN06272765_1134 [Streptomyces sp. Ag109_G2-15]